MIFLGNIYKDSYSQNYKLSPISATWLLNFIKKINQKVKIISFYHQPYFPFENSM